MGNVSNEKADESFEVNRPHNSGQLYGFLIKHKFQKALKSLPFEVKDLSVLDICCGSGMISEYYATRGAKVTGIDLSEEAIERAKIRRERYNFEADFKVADATSLPFGDNAFDVVSVHDGLHHLEDPKKAISEMVRVAKKGIIIIEPAKALITRIAVFVGFSTDYEGKDHVYRFKEHELKLWLREAGIEKIICQRYIMYYPHKPGRVFRIFDNYVLFYILTKLWSALNKGFGRLGNKIQVVGVKS